MSPVSPTRRDILAAFLGLPAALAGCSSGSDTPPLPDGKIVGTADGIGHRLRDGLRVIPPADRWQQRPVVIVGGGIAGLSAAWRLLKAGFHDFTLLELEATAGGTSRSGTSPVVSYPWGAHYLPKPLKENRLVVGLLDEMGILEGADAEGEPIVAEQFLCRDPQERLFFKGRWYEAHEMYLYAAASPDDLAQRQKFYAEVDRWVGWRDGKGRRAFALPTAAGSDDAEVTVLDKISMADWLDQRGLTSARLRWEIDYACRDDYGAHAEDVSAWAGLFYFASRKRQAGADSQPYLTWPEGNGYLANYFYRQAQPHVRLGLAVADVVPTDPEGRKGVDVFAVTADGREALGFHADQVLFAAPQFMARYVIRPYRDSPPRHLAEFEYGAWMVANLSLRERPASRGFSLCWDNVMYESPSLGYVVATHQRLLDYGPTVFTYYYPMCDKNPREARTRLLGLDWQSCADIALTDLQRAHPEIRTLVDRLDVMRWGHAMIRPRPGFVWGSSRAAALQPYRGIHFANADLSGVGLFEEAFYHGVRAAEEVLTARGVPFDSLL